ncbi:MAG: abortive infection family protein [Oscillospiraceae bacterium]|nr:abortive infection family protein [Oscillospiraceae bacterium]
MNTLTQIEKGVFLKLFIRNGYVLDFSTNDFDVFTFESVGVALCEKYQMSKGKSLTAFVSQSSDEKNIKLFKDLLKYYEENYEQEYKKDADEEFINYPYYKEAYSKLFEKCKSIIARVSNISTPLASNAEQLQEKFSSEYLSKQIDLMLKMQTENPTEAIGKAKELIESCCKTILDNRQVKWDKNWDMGKLTGETLTLLNLTPKQIPDSDPVAENIKAVLGNLRGITSKLAEIRNPYGSGHGKSATFTGLETRHAKLAVGCSITFVTFLWDTYEGGLST